MANQPIGPHSIRSPRAPRLSRRAFLLSLAFSTTSVALAACAPRTLRPEPLPSVSSPPLRILPSSQSPIPSEEGALTSFLALSALLTGVPMLDPGVGSLYLAHLQATNGLGLAALYAQAGFTTAAPPPTLQAIEAAGIFADEAMQQLADQIIALWYTGKYQDAQGNDIVVTFVDALAWKILDFTKPPTICGSPGFWAFQPALTTVGS